MIPRFASRIPPILAILLAACAEAPTETPSSVAPPIDAVASPRASASLDDHWNRTEAAVAARVLPSPRTTHAGDVDSSTGRGHVPSRLRAEPVRGIAAALACYREFSTAQALYQADQARWRAESDYAQTLTSQMAAVGAGVPEVSPPDPRLKLAAVRARQAFDREYGRLSADDKRRWDSELSSLSANTRNSRGRVPR